MKNKNMTKHLLLKWILGGLLIICSGTMIHAQNSNLTLSGIVEDEQGETLIGVTIFLKDRPGTGWITDIEGKFSVKAAAGDVLVFSYVGYDKFEYPVKEAKSNLKITMTQASSELEEVVITALGSTQRKINVTGAVTSVNVKDIQTPATSLNNMLGGRVPGVISLQTSGEPGKNISEFWIRGIGTFGASSGALVLVDGLESTLSQIDPADIESFSILKDASATAVYGVRGANGVVLVTTKRGQNERLKITVRSNVKLSVLQRMPEYLGAYDYAALANEASVVSDNLPLYSNVQMDIIKHGLDPDLYPNVNWRKEILNPISWQNTQYLSARGGGTVARYFMSLGMSTETAAYKQDKTSKYLKNVGYNTYNYRSNLDINLTKTTQVYMGIDGYISITNQPGMANTDWLWSSQAKLTPLTVPTRYSNGMLPAYGSNDNVSPYVLLNHTGMSTTEYYKNMITLALTEDLSFITKGLTAKLQGAFDSRSMFNERRHKMPDLYRSRGRNTDGELIMVRRVNAYAQQYGKSENQWRKYHLEANINYERIFEEKHRVGGLLYYYMTSERDTYNNTSMSAIPKRYQGISSRVTYGYNDTYMVDVNFGYTGSENFRKGQQFGFFPSVATGWIPTQYKWIQDNIPVLNHLKIRASYGHVGNSEISNNRFPYLTLINPNTSGGWGGIGLRETVTGADNLKWEVAKKADLGIEIKLFNNNLELIADVFHDQRDGIFQRRTQLPSWVGAMQMPYGNVGSMSSYGTDGNVTFYHTINDDMNFTLRANYTYSTSMVNNWEQPYQKYDYLSYTGKPYNVLRGFKAIGIFKDEQEILNSPSQFGKLRPGDLKYKDVTGDGRITDDDRVPLSYSPFPRLMYGFGGEFRYKDLTLGVLFKGTGRTDFFYNSNGFGYLPFYGGEIGNVLTIVKEQKNRWTPAWYSGDPSTENPDARFPRLTYGPNANNDVVSSFWLGNSSYLRLEEVTLNYNLKMKTLQALIGVNSVDLQLVGRNLAIWDKVKIWDPEQARRNGEAYPIPLTVAFQLYINF